MSQRNTVGLSCVLLLIGIVGTVPCNAEDLGIFGSPFGIPPVRSKHDPAKNKLLHKKLVGSEWRLATNGLTMSFEDGKFGVSDWGQRRGIWMVTGPNRTGGVGYEGSHQDVIFESGLRTGMLYVNGAPFSKLNRLPIASESFVIAMTRDQGKLGLLKLSTITGKATEIIELTVGDFDCFSLAFHEPTGRFLTVSISSPTLGIFDPALEKLAKIPIVGLPKNQTKISGITYQKNKDRILIGFGPSGGSHENRIAEIDLNGKVVNMSADLGLGDRDFLGWNSKTGDLLAADFNGGSPRIATVVDPFGRPSFKLFGNPPADSKLVDLAISKDGRMFTIRWPDNELVEIVDHNQLARIAKIETNGSVIGVTTVTQEWARRWRLIGQLDKLLKPLSALKTQPLFECVLGTYGQAIRGKRHPFVNLRPPNRNLWTAEIERQLKGTLSYGQVDYVGQAMLIIRESGTYSIDLPESGTHLRLNGVLMDAGDIVLRKGVYQVEIYTNHWSQPYLKYAHASVSKNGNKKHVPFVNTDDAIEKFLSQKILDHGVIEVCRYEAIRYQARPAQK